MKLFRRVFLHRFLLVSALGLAGCGDNEPAPDKVTEKKSAPAPAPKKTVSKKKTFADSEEGSFKVRYSAEDSRRKEPEVRDSRSNVNILKKDDPAAVEKPEKIARKEMELRQSFRIKRPAGSFADRLKDLNSGKLIRWSPQWRSDIASGVRLPAAAVSPDRTMIIIAETLGEPQGPFGTRLVFLDACSWTISAVHHLWKKDVRFIAAAPDHTVVLVSRGQTPFKSSDEIILMDPWSGREKQVLPLPGVRRVYVDHAGKLFAVFAPDSENSDRICIYSSLLKDGGTAFKEIRSSNRSPVIAFSPDHSRFAFSGNNAMEIFKSSDQRIEESASLPDGFVTADLLFLSGGTVIAAPESRLQRPAVVFQNNSCREFGEKSGGMLFDLPAADGALFGSVLANRGRLSQVLTSTLQEQSGVDPEEGRPRTVGDPMAVYAFKSIPAIAVLNERGCFYLLYLEPSGKRWRKEILIRSTHSK